MALYPVQELPTVVSRLEIGFPDERAEWCSTPAVFTEHELRIGGHPVMEDWERDYMATLASIATSNGGRVLELGYGMGISSSFLRSDSRVDEYWVVECHPQVVASAVAEMEVDLANGRAHIISGFWEDVIPLLADGSFDGILFDTYPLRAEEVHGNHFPFFEHARRLLAPGGVFTYYSDESTELSPEHVGRLNRAGFHNVAWKVVPVDPPADCGYWIESSLVAPIVKV